MEELIDLPDGKYVMPIKLWRRTRFVAVKDGSLVAKKVRCTIEDGRLVQFNTADVLMWYEENYEGRRLSKGFKFLYTAEDLNALVNVLPYSSRL